MDEIKGITIVNATDCISELLAAIDETERAENRLIATVAVKLRRLRRALGLTQSEVAEKCGIKQAMVSKMESGDYNPSIGNLFRYVVKMGGDFDLLITPQPAITTQVVGSCNCYGLAKGSIIEEPLPKLSQANQASKTYTSAFIETDWSKAV